MTYHPDVREPQRKRLLYGLRKVIGGYDAGDQMRPFYATAGRTFPALPGDLVLEPDGTTEAVFHWLTAPTVPPGLPRFSVMDDYVLPTKTGYHESGHALEEVLMRMYAGQNGWPYEMAQDHVRTRFWTARFDGNVSAGTWQSTLAESRAQTPGSMAEWMYLPGECWAECAANVVFGYFVGEKTMNYGIDLTPERLERMRQFFEDLMMEVGVMVMKTYEFSAPLVNGGFTWIGPMAAPAGAIRLTEAQRVTLGLVPGRQYTADMERIWLAGSESTFPDCLATIYEDASAPIGATGRWRLGVAARGDFGGTGRYAVRIAPKTASVVT